MDKATDYQKRDHSGAGFGADDRTSDYMGDTETKSLAPNMPHSIEA